MAVRFITSWKGYQPGDTASLGADEAALIAGGIARDAAENDNSGATDLQAQIAALGGRLPTAAGDHANDAAAEVAGVAVGAMYHTGGAAKVRVA